jgi:hypothetical protein
MRMNKSMARRLASTGLNPRRAHVNVAPRLQSLAAARLVARDGCLILEPLAHVEKFQVARFHDRTGYESFANKIHVADYLDDDASNAQDQLQQGIGYGLALGARLLERGSFLVILSVDRESGHTVVRFHEQRAGEGWLADDLEGYQMEDVLVLEPGDFGSSGAPLA